MQRSNQFSPPLSTVKSNYMTKKEVVLYGYCVKADVVKISKRVVKYFIEDEFSQYWGIPNIAFGII